jgi:hypothetical protein
MTAHQRLANHVTVSFHLADGSSLSLTTGPTALRFVGRYSRLPAFGPVDRPLSATVIPRR